MNNYPCDTFIACNETIMKTTGQAMRFYIPILFSEIGLEMYCATLPNSQVASTLEATKFFLKFSFIKTGNKGNSSTAK